MNIKKQTILKHVEGFHCGSCPMLKWEDRRFNCKKYTNDYLLWKLYQGSMIYVLRHTKCWKELGDYNV